MHRESDKRIMVYYSCAPVKKDQQLRERLDKQLAVWLQKGLINTWHDGLLGAGENLDQAIRYLEQAHIILLLISPDYLSSEYCYTQMQLAIQRQHAAIAHVIPVLLRPTPGWQETLLGQIQPPVMLRANSDAAWADVVDEIHHVLELAIKKQKQTHILRPLRDQPPHPHPTNLPREALVREIYCRLIQPDISALALTGLGGVGKTTLAAQVYYYAEEQRRIGHGPFIREALWLRIRPMLTMIDLLTMIAQAQGQRVKDFEYLASQELAIELFQLCEYPDSGSYQLIVLDKFEDWLDMQGTPLATHMAAGEWLDMLNEHSCSCRFLLTSRIMPQGYETHRKIYMREMEINRIDRQEGIKLLRLWDLRGSDQELARVVEKLPRPYPGTGVFEKLLQLHHMRPVELLDNPTYRQSWIEDVGKKLFHNLYDQLDELQHALLHVLAVYREAVPWTAIHTILKMTGQATEKQVIQAITILRTHRLLLVQEGEQVRYELHPLIAEFVLGLFSETDKRIVHENIARYYQLAFPPSPRMWRRCVADVHTSVEATWHYCQAGRCRDGYTLIEQEQLFADLLRWGEYGVLFELYTLLLPLKRWQPETLLAARIFVELGQVNSSLGRKNDAQTHFEQALSLYREAEFPTGIVRTLNNLGAVQRVLGEIDCALQCYQEALSICERIQEPAEHGITLNNLGRALQSLGQNEQTSRKQTKLYRQALTHYKRALALHRTVGDLSETAQTLNNIGEIYDCLRQREEADKYYQQALKHFRDSGERQGEGITYNNLGVLYRKSGQTNEALQYLAQAIQIFRETGDQWKEAIALRNLGRLCVLLRKNDACLACFLEARDIYRSLRCPERSTIPLFATVCGEKSPEDAIAGIYPRRLQIIKKLLDDLQVY